MFVSVLGTCIGCREPFSFHPNLVPSVRVRGSREPICKACVDKANPERIKRGLAPIAILPGAYEAAAEAEVNWEG